MSHLKAWQRALLNSLHADLASEGYRTRAQRLERATSWGRHIIHLAFVSHRTEFDVVLNFAVRHDAVENLVNESGSFRKERDKDETATVGCEAGILLGNGQMRWSISRQEDVPVATQGILEKIRQVGFPFIERFSAVDELYRVLSKDDREAERYSPFPGSRGMRAVALASVIGRKDDIPYLVRVKTPIIKRGQDDLNLDRFLRLAQALAAH